MDFFIECISSITSCLLFLFHVKPDLSKELSKVRKARRLLERKKAVDVRHPKIERFEKEKMKSQKQGKDMQEEIKYDQFKVLKGENQQKAVREMKMDWNGTEKSNNQELETKEAERNKQVRIEILKNEKLREERRRIEANDQQIEAAERLQKEMLPAETWNKVTQNFFERIEKERQQEKEQVKEENWDNRIDRMEKRRSLARMNKKTPAKKTPLMSRLRSLGSSPKGKS